MTPVCRYFTVRVGHNTDELWCQWEDGVLARLRPAWYNADGQHPAEWVAVRGPDYLAIRAEIEHPERTLPPVQAD